MLTFEMTGPGVDSTLVLKFIILLLKQLVKFSKC